MKLDYEKPVAEYISFELEENIMNELDEEVDPIPSGSYVEGDDFVWE